VSISLGGLIKVWHTNDWSELLALQGEAYLHEPAFLALTPDGKHAISGRSSSRHILEHLTVWDLLSPQRHRPPTPSWRGIHSAWDMSRRRPDQRLEKLRGPEVYSDYSALTVAPC